MSRKIARISILVVLCFTSSCYPSIKSEPGTPSDLAQAVEPHKTFVTKIRQQYPPDQYLIGIGQADSEKAATELARADLIKQIRVEVRVTWTDLLRERSGKTEQEVSRLVESRVEELVQGIEIVEQGRDPAAGMAYAVAVLPRDEMARILKSARVEEEKVSPSLDSSGEKEEVWVTAEGIVTLGEETTVAEAKARSRDEARRKAIELAVGTFVRGQTLTYNAQVADDFVRSLVRGIVVEEQILEEGIRQLGQESGPSALQYSTKLRAKVKPIRMERRGDFALKAELNKTVFHEGEEIQIRAVSTKDAYLNIFSVGQDGTVTVLLPNRFAPANFIHANSELIFPDEEQLSLGIRLRVFPPAGAKKAIEKIKLIATTKPIDLIEGKIREGTFQVYPGKDATLVTDLLKTLSLLDESDWAEATVLYEVRK